MEIVSIIVGGLAKAAIVCVGAGAVLGAVLIYAHLSFVNYGKEKWTY